MAELRSSMDNLAMQANASKKGSTESESMRCAMYRKRRTSDLKKWRELLKRKEQRSDLGAGNQGGYHSVSRPTYTQSLLSNK